MKRRGGRGASLVLIISGLVLLASIVYARMGQRRFQLGVESWATVPDVLVNTTARPFLVETVTRDTARVEPGENPVVLIVYSPDCRFCGLSVRNWHRLARSMCDDVHIIAVSRERLEAQRHYWSKLGQLGRPDCAMTPVVGRLMDAARFKSQYGVRVIPTIFVISAGGSVTRVWEGASGRRAALDSLLAAIGGLL